MRSWLIDSCYWQTIVRHVANVTSAQLIIVVYEKYFAKRPTLTCSVRVSSPIVDFFVNFWVSSKFNVTTLPS